MFRWKTGLLLLLPLLPSCATSPARATLETAASLPSDTLRAQLEALLARAKAQGTGWIGFAPTRHPPFFVVDPQLFALSGRRLSPLPDTWLSDWAANGLIDGVRSHNSPRRATALDTVQITLYLPSRNPDGTVTGTVAVDYTVPHGSLDCGATAALLLTPGGTGRWKVDSVLGTLVC